MKLFSRRQAKPPTYLLPLRKKILADPTLTSQLWGCVSLSRSQYNTHYGTAIERFGRYLQSEERLNIALRTATDQLQDSLIYRLPHHRDREESARFEQLWKFTCFLKPLLSAAMKTDRRWYNKHQQETASFVGAVYYRDYPGPARHTIIKLNLLNFVHPIGGDWLLQDDLRCIESLYQFIDSAGDTLPVQQVASVPAEQLKKSTATVDTATAVKPSDPDPSPGPVVPDPDFNDAADNQQETSSVPTDNPLQPEVSAELFNRFTDWLPDDARVLKDDHVYIESPITIEQFIADNHLTVSVGDVQQSLLTHGFTRAIITLGKKKRISCLRVPEEAHV